MVLRWEKAREVTNFFLNSVTFFAQKSDAYSSLLSGVRHR